MSLLKSSPKKMSYSVENSSPNLWSISRTSWTPQTSLPLHETLTVTLSKIILSHIMRKPPQQAWWVPRGTQLISQPHTTGVPLLPWRKEAGLSHTCVYRLILPSPNGSSHRAPSLPESQVEVCVCFSNPLLQTSGETALNPCCQLQNWATSGCDSTQTFRPLAASLVWCPWFPEPDKMQGKTSTLRPWVTSSKWPTLSIFSFPVCRIRILKLTPHRIVCILCLIEKNAADRCGDRAQWGPTVKTQYMAKALIVAERTAVSCTKDSSRYQNPLEKPAQAYYHLLAKIRKHPKPLIGRQHQNS